MGLDYSSMFLENIILVQPSLPKKNMGDKTIIPRLNLISFQIHRKTIPIDLMFYNDNK
jgi:hypothetical protein